MSILARALAALAAMFVCGTAQAQSLPPPPDLFANLPSANDPRAVKFANGAILLGDLPYRVMPGIRPLRLDLYLPSSRRPGAALPIVMWIHGGAFELGDPRTEMSWRDWPQVLARLAARGYAVAAVSYRLSGEAKFPAQTEDLRAALGFLASNAARWHLDPAHVFTWGGSAGGHLAQMVGLQANPRIDPFRIRGILDWYGPSDLEAQYVAGSNTPASRLLGCANAVCSPENLRAASPIYQVTSSAPPMLIMHGTADSLVPIEQSRQMATRMRAAGAAVSLVSYPGLEHGFWRASPAQLDEILARSFAFFDAHARD